MKGNEMIFQITIYICGFVGVVLVSGEGVKIHRK